MSMMKKNGIHSIIINVDKNNSYTFEIINIETGAIRLTYKNNGAIGNPTDYTLNLVSQPDPIIAVTTINHENSEITINYDINTKNIHITSIIYTLPGTYGVLSDNVFYINGEEFVITIDESKHSAIVTKNDSYVDTHPIDQFQQETQTISYSINDVIYEFIIYYYSDSNTIKIESMNQFNP